MSTTFVSQVNGNDIYAKRAERTRSGLNIETIGSGEGAIKGILPAGLVPGSEGTNEANTLATQQYVLDQMGSVADALVFKGTIGAAADTPTVTELPATHKIGWTYKVATAGTYAGKVCELGDMVICVKNGTVAADADWTVVQNNIDGAVTGPVSVGADGNLAVYNGTTGKIIKDSSIAAANVALKGEMSVVAGTGTDADKTTITLKSGTSATVLTAHQDISGKADKVSGATDGNFAGLDANGNLTDSGSKASDFKTKQTAKADPTASGEALSFIDSISQDANGEITATKKSVKVASTYTGTGEGSTDPVNGQAVKAAIDALDAEVTSSDGTNVQVKVTEADGKITAVSITDSTASSTHVHGNLSNDGKVGTDANRAIVTGTGGAIEAANLTTADPTAEGTATSGLAYIDSVSQGSNGKLSATKTYVPVAGNTASAYGVVYLGTVSLD